MSGQRIGNEPVVERRYLADEEAQVRALRLLADRTIRPNKAAGTSGGKKMTR